MKMKRAGLTLTAACGAFALGACLWLSAHAQEGGKTPAPTGKITPWAAMKIATGKVPGSRALNANFEFDEGHWVYGVMVVTGGEKKELKEVEIDPTSGKVGDVESITPEGEAKETAAELNKALGKSGGAAEKGEKDEKDEKPEKPAK